MVDKLQIGYITGTHGIRGLVKVTPTTDDPKRFTDLNNVILIDEDQNEMRLTVAQVRFHKDSVLLGFDGYEDINLVEGFKGHSVFVDRADAVALKDNEYYVADLIGLDVFSVKDDEKELIGKVDNVLETGANDVFVIRRKNRSELLIPSIRECIREIDPEHGSMTVTLLPGMEEL